MVHWIIIHMLVVHFFGALFDGESVWMIPMQSNDLIKINPSDGSITSYTHGKGFNVFRGGCFDGESIWLIPYSSSDLVKVNPSDGSMTSYTHGLGSNAFIGGVFDGESVWMVPSESTTIVRFTPPELGRPSLHTRGVLNVGTSAIIGSYDNTHLSITPDIQTSGTTYLINTSTSGDLSLGIDGDDVINIKRGGVADLPDVYTVPFTDYTSSSTIVGFSSTTTESVWYRLLGHYIYIRFEFDGTSNSSELSFTLPYQLEPSQYGCGSGLQGSDEGCQIYSSSTKVIISKGISYAGFGANNWTASGTKSVAGSFTALLRVSAPA